MDEKFYSFKQRKCWSCQYYAGSREYEDGFFGDKFVVEDRALCTNSRGNRRKDGTTSADCSSCSHYRRAGEVEAVIRAKEMEREQASRARQIQEEEGRRQQEEERRIEEERNSLKEEQAKLRKERERLEHERWLQSLSPGERTKVEKAEEEKRKKEKELAEISEELRRLEQEEEKEKEPLKKKKEKYERARTKWKLRYFLPEGIIFSIIFLFFTTVLWIAYFHQMESLSTCVTLTILSLLSLALIVVPILFHIHWRNKGANIEKRLAEKNPHSNVPVFYEALCYTQTQNAIGDYLEQQHSQKQTITEEDGPALISHIQSYYKGRVGLLDGKPVIGIEDMESFLVMLTSGGKLTFVQDSLKNKGIGHHPSDGCHARED